MPYLPDLQEGTLVAFDDIELRKPDELIGVLRPPIPLQSYMQYVRTENAKPRPKNPAKPCCTPSERQNPSSDSLHSITEKTSKMTIGAQQSTTSKRSVIKSARRTKHYTPYTSSQEPILVQPSQITLTQVLKQKRIGRPPKKVGGSEQKL